MFADLIYSRFRYEQVECKSQRNWDQSMILKEDTEAIFLGKQEAIIKRERMKKYSFSHRVITSPMTFPLKLGSNTSKFHLILFYWKLKKRITLSFLLISVVCVKNCVN